jgi:REP element-mobilizing transposase RayT/DNA-binding response OmpR family regulator
VLVVTPNESFGEMILQVLSEAGSYEGALVKSGKEAVEIAQLKPPILFILDADLEDAPLEELVHVLREVVPNMKLIIIPRDEGHEPSLKDLGADGSLTKPFYIPDLLSTIGEVIGLGRSELIEPAEAETQPANSQLVPDEEIGVGHASQWLQDVSLAAQHLTRLSLESSSQAALITRQDQIWAYAGELPQPAVDELAYNVAKYWADDGGADLARFVRLDATDSEFILYATGLGGDFILSLVFEAETPFNIIRSQAGMLARALATAPTEQPTESALHPEVPPLTSEGDDGGLVTLGEDEPFTIPSDWMPHSIPSQGRKDFMDDLFSNEQVVDEVKTRDAPSPVAPLSESSNNSLTTDEKFESKPFDDVLQDRLSSIAMQAGVSDHEEEDTTDDKDIPEEREEVEPLDVPDLHKESLNGVQEEPIPLESIEPAQSLEETMPSPGEGFPKRFKLEPVSPAMYNLTYACVLIARLPEHHLTGELANTLSDWVYQLCLAFGWRLEQISIRPDYLQWMVNVPPTTSPGYFMRIIRQHTSRRLFVDFPGLEKANPSGDFWAPGYLIVSGMQPPPPKLIKDFIAQTRERQGVSKTTK